MCTRCFDTMWTVNIFFGQTLNPKPGQVKLHQTCLSSFGPHVLMNVLPGVDTVWTVSFFFFGGGSFIEHHLLLHLVWYFGEMFTSYCEVFLSSFFGIFMELVLFPFGLIFWGRLAQCYCEVFWVHFLGSSWNLSYFHLASYFEEGLPDVIVGLHETSWNISYCDGCWFELFHAGESPSRLSRTCLPNMFVQLLLFKANQSKPN
jgi:hypothetical protein